MTYTHEQILDLINAEDVLSELIDNYVQVRKEKFPKLVNYEGWIKSYSFDMDRGMVEVQLRFTWAYGGESNTYCEFPLAHLSLTEEERDAVWQAEEDAWNAKEDAIEEDHRQKLEAQERAQLDELTKKYGVA